MSIQKLHWLIKERYNKLDSNHYRDLTPMEIDQAADDATFQLMEFVFDNEKQPAFDMIANLVVTASEQPALTPKATTTDAVGIVYEFDLSNLLYPYYHYKRAFAVTDCGLVKVELVGHGRLSDVLNDQFSKPSKKWKRLVGTIAKNSTENDYSLYIYSETGFAIESLSLEYVRLPRKVFFGGYDSIEYLECLSNGGTASTCSQYYNSATAPQDSEIDETYHTLLADFAVRELSRILKDGASFQLQTEKVSHSIT